MSPQDIVNIEAAAGITIETAIEGEQADAFYQLYLEAFEPLRTRAVARQVLHGDEFFEEMSNPLVWKYVAWEDDQPVGMSTLTRHLETVPWISPEYFSSRFPEHAARDAIYYLGFTLMHPGQRSSRLLSRMLDAVIQTLVADQAVCAYDVCAYNDTVLRFGAHMEMLLHRSADVEVERIDTQTYYLAAFAGEQ